jgi:hypothetical protein
VREGESSVIDALTHLPRGQRVLIIKKNLSRGLNIHSQKNHTKKIRQVLCGGSCTKLQIVLSLFETGIFERL